MTVNRQKTSIFGSVAMILTFLYVCAAYTFTYIAGASSVCYVLAVLLLVAATLQVLVEGRGFPQYFYLPWIFLAFCAISIIWSQDSEEGMMATAQTASPMFGGLGVWLVAPREGLGKPSSGRRLSARSRLLQLRCIKFEKRVYRAEAPGSPATPTILQCAFPSRP